MRSILEVPGPIERTTNRLPVGRAPLQAFVADAETERVLRECLTELAHANPIIARGGIAKAVETLAAERSPNILIVDISGVDLPKGLPLDVPLYAGGRVTAGVIDKAGAFRIVMTTSDKLPRVVAYFTGQLRDKGWKQTGTPYPELVTERRSAFIVDRSQMTATDQTQKIISVPTK